jgi:hypothetical protein
MNTSIYKTFDPPNLTGNHPGNNARAVRRAGKGPGIFLGGGRDAFVHPVDKTGGPKKRAEDWYKYPCGWYYYYYYYYYYCYYWYQPMKRLLTTAAAAEKR